MGSTPEGAARRGGPVPIGDAIATYLKKSGLQRRPLSGRVFDAWRKAAGELAGHAVPVRFRGGKLLVEVDSAAHLHELANFTGEALRARANGLLEVEAIRTVDFKRKT